MTTYFSWRNWLDASIAQLVADVEAGDLLVSNLRERQGYKVWRTDGLSVEDAGAGFGVDFGATRSLQVLALMFPRDNDPLLYDATPAFGASDTIRHRLSAVSIGGDELYDSGAIASGVLGGYGYHVLKLASPVSARYWRCDLDAASRAALGYVDVARAWAGPVFQPRVNFDFGDSYSWRSDSPIPKAARGISEFPDIGEAYRAWSMNFGAINDAEREELLEFERIVTGAAQFLVVRDDVAAGKGSMLARQESSAGLASLAHLRNTKAMRLVESL